MKKLEVKSTKTVVETVFEAEDGMKFNTESECLQYEDALKKTLIGELLRKDEVMCTADLEALTGDGECVYKSIIPVSEESIRDLNTLYHLFGGRGKTENKFTSHDIGKLILVGIRYYEDDNWVWFVNLSDVVDAVSGGRCYIEQFKVRNEPTSKE